MRTRGAIASMLLLGWALGCPGEDASAPGGTTAAPPPTSSPEVETARPPVDATAAVEQPAVPSGSALSGSAPSSSEARANAAVADLQQTLLPRLLAGVEEGGPAGGIEVCSQVAQRLTAEVGTRHGVRIGRTSHRLRNPRNAPPSWARDVVMQAAGKSAEEVRTQVIEGDGFVGILRPIPTGGLCLKCHGPTDDLSPEVTKILAERYPDDQATGFREGDLRGWFWVEVPKRPVGAKGD